MPSLTVDLDQKVNGRHENRSNKYQSRASDNHTFSVCEFSSYPPGTFKDVPILQEPVGCYTDKHNLRMLSGIWHWGMLILSLDLRTGTGQHRRNIERKGPLANPSILHPELSLKRLSGLWYLAEYCRYRNKMPDSTGRK